MTNLNEIKNKISKYDWMTYSEYKNLKEEIFSLDDDSISELYGTTMDSIDERETELMHLEREEARYSNWYARTKYFRKLYSEISDYMFDLYEKEMDKPIEQKLVEDSTEFVQNYLEVLETYEGDMMKPKVVQKHIQICKEVLSSRGL